jgi:signal transduction histidine kinase
VYTIQLKFTHLVWAVVLLSAGSSLAQALDKEDSLLRKLTGSVGEERYLVLYELVKLNYATDFEKTELFAREANQIAYTLGDSAKIVKSARALGYVQSELGKNDEAVQILATALAIAKRNRMLDQVRYLLNNLAIASMNMGAYDRALDYNFQSLVIREREGDKLEISISCHNIGTVYYKLNDLTQALNYYERALRLRREIGSDFGLSTLLANIALCRISLHYLDEALDAAEEALGSCGNECSNQVIMDANFVLALVKRQSGALRESREFYLKALESARKLGNNRIAVDCMTAIGSSYAAEGNGAEALMYFKETEAMLDTLNLRREESRLYREMASLYRQTGELEKTVEYQDRYIRVYDSLMNQELIKNIARIQTDHEERQNIQTIDRQRKLNLYIVVIAGLATLLVFVLYRSNVVKRRVNRQLSEAKETIETQNKQLSGLNRNLERMVESRTQQLKTTNEALKRVNSELDNFIYKTSHDIRGPLASLKGMCNVALLDVKDPLSLDYFAKLDATAERLNTILTRLLIINQINNSPPAFEMIDLDELLDDVIHTQKKKGLPHRMTFQKEVEPNLIFYSDRALIRIILENLIDNAIKFHNDSERIEPRVLVRARKTENEIAVRVLDNGIGITQADPDKIFQMFSRASERSDTGGIGLYLTKTATEKVGGRIDLRTTPEGYTEFCVTFAIQNGRIRREGAA